MFGDAPLDHLPNAEIFFKTTWMNAISLVMPYSDPALKKKYVKYSNIYIVDERQPN